MHNKITLKSKHLRYLLLLWDWLSIIIALSLGILIRFNGFKPLPPTGGWRSYLLFYGLFSIIWMSSFYFCELYENKRLSLYSNISGVTIGFVIINLIWFYFQDIAVSRGLLLITSGLLSILTLGLRTILKILSQSRWRILLAKRAILLGINKETLRVHKVLETYDKGEYQILGYVIINDNEKSDNEKQTILGNLIQLNDIIQEYKIEEVILSENSIPYEQLLDIIANTDSTVHFKLVPDLYEIMLGKVTLAHLQDVPLIDLMLEPVSGWNKTVKRFMDVTISLIGLLLFVLILPILAILIKLDSAGSVFYKQTRIGKGGKPFIMYKLRSMPIDAEKDTGPVWATKEDKRIRRLGKFLRNSSLDEIPQFWNILKGEMSIVGPRPERPHFIKQHRELQNQRLVVKPGLTGLAQVHGRYELDIEEKTAYDLYYIRNYSLILDLEIIFRTIGVALSRKGAY